MKVYIDGEEVKVEVAPINKPTLDETLETLSFVMLSSSQNEPYKPMTDVYFEDDNGKKTPFVITTDSIEIACSNPVKYKHTITCVEGSRKLSKKLIRNSCFAQPPNQTKQSFTAASFVLTGPTSSVESPKITDYRATLSYLADIDISTMQDGSEPLVMVTNEKMLNSYIEIDCKGVLTYQKTTDTSNTWTDTNWTVFKSMAQLSTLCNQAGSGYSFVIGSSPLRFKYIKNGTLYEDALTVEDLNIGAWSKLLLNKKYKCDKIKNLANQGANNFYFIFPTAPADFVDIKQLKPYVSASATKRYQYPAYLIFQLKIIADTYCYNGNDILDLLNTRYMQEYEVNIPSGYTYDSGGTEVVKRNKLFNPYIYDTETRTALQSYIPPSLTFTQNTAYECVAEVFRGLDAIFSFEYHESGGVVSDDNLKIQYFNNWSGTQITPHFSGVQMVLGEDTYNNGLVSYYQDGRVEVETGYLPIRSQELGVPQENDHAIIVPKPINTIKKVEFLTHKATLGTYFYAGSPTSLMKLSVAQIGAIDLTRYVVEESIWSLLPKISVNVSNITTPHTLYQVNTLPYSQGSNYIDVGKTNSNWLGQKWYVLATVFKYAFLRELGIWGNSQHFLSSLSDVSNTDKWYDLYFNVKYESTNDGRVVLESLENKYMGESLVDTYGGAIDLNKMGLNMLGLSLKMGQPTLLANHVISKWENRIKQGEVYLKDGEFWIANVCSYTILNNGMLKGSVSFVKNFNSLSLQTRLSKEKRLSNISNNLIAKSEGNIVDYIYVDTRHVKNLVGITTSPIALYCNYLPQALIGTFDNSKPTTTLKPQQAVIQTDEMEDLAYIPLIKYGLGNSICFEMNCDHPMNVGNRTTANNSGWFGTAAYFTTATRYTDKYGYFNKCSVFIGQGSIGQNYPILEYSDFNEMVAIKNLAYYKQPNEIFALNYQLCFLPLDAQYDFVMPAFINNNYLINSDRTEVKCSAENSYFRFYYDKDGTGIKYSPLDVKAIENANKDNYIPIVDVSYITSVTGSAYLTFTLQSEIPVTTGSWCIADNDGNVYIASNRARADGRLTITIGFYPMNKRRT